LPSLEGYPTDLIGNDGTTAIWWMGPQVIVYNTDLVDEADVPESYEDLLDDRFAGEILMVDPRRFPTFLDFCSVLHGEYGDAFLTDLAAQDPRIVESSTPGLQALAAGEAELLFPTLPVAALALIDQGAPVDYVILEP